MRTANSRRGTSRPPIPAERIRLLLFFEAVIYGCIPCTARVCANSRRAWPLQKEILQTGHHILLLVVRTHKSLLPSENRCFGAVQHMKLA